MDQTLKICLLWKYCRNIQQFMGLLCPVVKCIIRDENHKDFLLNGPLNDSFGNFFYFIWTNYEIILNRAVIYLYAHRTYPYTKHENYNYNNTSTTPHQQRITWFLF